MTGMRTAGIVSRSLAALIDLGVVLLLMVGGYAAILLGLLFVKARDFTVPQVPWLFTVPVFLGLSVAYLFVCWASFGRSVGHATMGLRVVRRTRDAGPGPLRCLGRAAFCAFFPIGILWVIVSPARRSVQDVVLATRVVYEGRE